MHLGDAKLDDLVMVVLGKGSIIYILSIIASRVVLILYIAYVIYMHLPIPLYIYTIFNFHIILYIFPSGIG